MATLTFKPISRIISNITKANPAVVTTTEDHGYLDGLYVRFFLPGNFGMRSLNNNVYLATILSDDTFSIDASTVGDDAFTTAITTNQDPQVIPVAEISSTLANAERNNLTPVGG